NKDLVDGLSTTNGPTAISLLSYVDFEFATPDVNCKENNWEQLAFLNFDERSNPPKSEENNCFPESVNTHFCGQGKASESYTSRCVNEDMKIRSCYNRMTIDVALICKKYMKISGEITKSEILTCIETMSAFACNQIPCEISTDNKDESGKIKRLQTVLYNNGNDIFSRAFKGSGRLKSIEDLKKVPRISGNNDFNHYPTSAGGGPPSKKRIDMIPLLNHDNWGSIKLDSFEEHLLKLTMYYKYNISEKCKFDDGVIQKALEGSN
ncbi:MAG: hypothetical protein KDD37_03100, partial [Bdellovibrionales bacterium]|nr:hypothetical protein [Bdellovibrionales bacterium]